MLRFLKASVKKSLSKLIPLGLCLVLCAGWAFAAVTGSISVFLTDDDDRPVGGVGIVLHRVAEPDGSLTAPFAGANVDLTSGLDNAKHAKTLADLAAARGISGDEKTTADDGRVKYEGLTEGIYLILCRPGQRVTFTPYLVYLPTVINGAADYDVESFPKAEDVIPVVPPAPDDPILYRVTYSYYGYVPDGAPLCPEEEWYAAGVTVNVYPEAVVEGYSFRWTYDPIQLPTANLAALAVRQVRSTVGVAKLGMSLLTSPMDGRETLSADSFTMPANDVHIIGVFATSGEPEPTESPDPTDSPEPTDSPDPGGPNLPQTGVKVWPVYLLLGVGSVLVVVGLIDLCVTRRKRDE